MTMPTRDQLLDDARSALIQSESQYGEMEPRFNAIYLALRAIACAQLAETMPVVETKMLATFGEAQPAFQEPTVAPAHLPLFTMRVNHNEGPSHPRLEFVHHGDEDQVVLGWALGEDELDSEGRVGDVAALAAWAADGIVKAFSMEQRWDRGLTTSTLIAAGEILTGES